MLLTFRESVENVFDVLTIRRRGLYVLNALTAGVVICVLFGYGLVDYVTFVSGEYNSGLLPNFMS